MVLSLENFTQLNVVGQQLYDRYAATLPIIDYHSRLSPRRIYENRPYKNITQLWLTNDPYKQQLLHTHPEVTTDTDDRGQFLAWAQVATQNADQPVCAWSRLELKHFLRTDNALTMANAPAIWDQTKAMLATAPCRPKALLQQANVQTICTPATPIADLKYYHLLANQKQDNGFEVLPVMDAARLFDIENPVFGDYLAQLSLAAGMMVMSFEGLVQALEQRMVYFETVGGKLYDCSLGAFQFVKATPNELELIFEKGANGEPLTASERHAYQTGLLLAMMRLSVKHQWALKLHLSLQGMRDRILGAACDFAAPGSQTAPAHELMKLLRYVNGIHLLPRTILEIPNPHDWRELATELGQFHDRVQLGCTWGLQNAQANLQHQLEILATNHLLPGYTGLLTDTRTLLTYPRHQYFRQVLCHYLGQQVLAGQIADDEPHLAQLVADVVFNNVQRFLNIG